MIKKTKMDFEGVMARVKGETNAFAAREVKHVNHDVENITPLFLAAMVSDLPSVVALIQLGANVNHEFHFGCPNRYAVEIANDLDIVRVLVRHGACDESLIRLLRRRVVLSDTCIAKFLLDLGHRLDSTQTRSHKWISRHYAERNAQRRAIVATEGALRRAAPMLCKNVRRMVLEWMWRMRND